jgi:hypothetical protein
MGGMFGWKDFVILCEFGQSFSMPSRFIECPVRGTVRYNALSRVIEAALQAEGIPHRVLAGFRFFERMEVRQITAFFFLLVCESCAIFLLPLGQRSAILPPTH